VVQERAKKKRSDIGAAGNAWLRKDIRTGAKRTSWAYEVQLKDANLNADSERGMPQSILGIGALIIVDKHVSQVAHLSPREFEGTLRGNPVHSSAKPLPKSPDCGTRDPAGCARVSFQGPAVRHIR